MLLEVLVKEGLLVSTLANSQERQVLLLPKERQMIRMDRMMKRSLPLKRAMERLQKKIRMRRKKRIPRNQKRVHRKTFHFRSFRKSICS